MYTLCTNISIAYTRRQIRAAAGGMQRNTHTSAYTHAHTQGSMWTQREWECTHTHARCDTHRHTHTHMGAHTHVGAHGPTHKWACIGARIGTHTHTHTHTHCPTQELRDPPR